MMEDLVIMSREKADELDKEIKEWEKCANNWQTLYEENGKMLAFLIRKVGIEIKDTHLILGGGAITVPMLNEDKEIIEKFKEALSWKV